MKSYPSSGWFQADGATLSLGKYRLENQFTYAFLTSVYSFTPLRRPSNTPLGLTDLESSRYSSYPSKAFEEKARANRCRRVFRLSVKDRISSCSRLPR